MSEPYIDYAVNVVAHSKWATDRKLYGVKGFSQSYTCPTEGCANCAPPSYTNGYNRAFTRPWTASDRQLTAPATCGPTEAATLDMVSRQILTEVTKSVLSTSKAPNKDHQCRRLQGGHKVSW
ncbi:uncharacterized protein IL334_004042 [Kwoniella shivajii]|uniref:Uncharacterized protein n=1 Tax=Kwoniella shivajii TaxID=564305 RepID=A0ABZ1CZ82_9TREE|nr:hypothetical protein IL334_004042 [Kwoniella shivajii]